MNQNEQTIHNFYTAFATLNVTAMCECYHKNIQFQYPIFGVLKETDVCHMWKMLIEKSEGNIKIEFKDIKANSFTGLAQWTATYNFSKTNRIVVNVINTQFQFQDGLISRHTDLFDIWKWSKQALGFKGLFLGWTGFMHRKIQKKAAVSLKNYIERPV